MQQLVGRGDQVILRGTDEQLSQARDGRDSLLGHLELDLQALVDLHSAIFGLSPEEARGSAKWRLLAANTVDLITSKLSVDIEGDWSKLEEYLRQCYRSIQRELKSVHPQRAF